jgi:hypothetical protein
MLQKDLINKGAQQLRDLHETVQRRYDVYRKTKSAADLEAWKRATASTNSSPSRVA